MWYRRGYPEWEILYSLNVLGDEIDSLRILEMIDKLYDVRVVDFVQYLYLFFGEHDYLLRWGFVFTLSHVFYFFDGVGQIGLVMKV